MVKDINKLLGTSLAALFATTILTNTAQAAETTPPPQEATIQTQLNAQEPASGAENEEEVEDLFDIGLDNLANIKVTSVSRQEEDAFRAAAAIFVITGEDIRRSGVTTIADALRLAPGMNVARSSTSEWGVSTRGFNSGFANKLLVQIDGRSVYTPLYSGVYWSVQDLALDDVKQIEIIRGPGATLWGANAVNGIINIITKTASDTEGGLLTASLGKFEKSSVTVRRGGKLEENGSYRVYGKFIERDDLRTATDQPAKDDFNQGRAGFRADWQGNKNNKFTVQGDIYKGDQGLNMTVPASPDNILREETLVESGGNVLARWTSTLEDGSETKLQAYFDRTRFDYSLLDQYTHTYDIDFQHAKTLNRSNELVWGAGYRSISDNLRDSFNIDFSPTERTVDLWSAFVQNKITAIPDKLYFTVGSKFEKNDFTGFEFQPSARVAWYPSDNQTFWASVSKAVRTPSRAEDDIKIIFSKLSGAFVRQEGNKAFTSENLVAYELGYRMKPNKKYMPSLIDIAAFFNDYSDLRTADIGAVTIENGNVFIPILTNNKGYGESYGVEVSAEWEIKNNWRVITNYSFLNMTLHTEEGSTDGELALDEGRSPKNQFNLISRLDLTQDIEFDTSLYYVDNLPSFNIPNYIRLDARVGWKLNDDITFDLIGQNLLDDLHPEFEAPFYVGDNQVPRIFYGRVTWKF